MIREISTDSLGDPQGKIIYFRSVLLPIVYNTYAHVAEQTDCPKMSPKFIPKADKISVSHWPGDDGKYNKLSKSKHLTCATGYPPATDFHDAVS